MPWQSISALVAAQSRSCGLVFLELLTVTHSQLSTPIRLVSPSYDPVSSNGDSFTPTRFDALLGTDRADQPASLAISVESVSGVLLAQVQTLDTPALLTYQIVASDDPDTIQLEVSDFELLQAEQIGLSGMMFEAAASRFLGLPFPGFNMDRGRVPGIYTDL